MSYRFNAAGFGPSCDPNQRPAFDVRHPRSAPPSNNNVAAPFLTPSR
jgi:hypothetical protein